MALLEVIMIIKKIIVGIVLILVPVLTFYAGIKFMAKTLTDICRETKAKDEVLFTLHDLKTY